MKRKSNEKGRHRLWCIGRYKLAAARQLVAMIPGIEPQNVLGVHLCNDDYLNDLAPLGTLPIPRGRARLTLLGMETLMPEPRGK